MPGEQVKSRQELLTVAGSETTNNILFFSLNHIQCIKPQHIHLNSEKIHLFSRVAIIHVLFTNGKLLVTPVFHPTSGGPSRVKQGHHPESSASPHARAQRPTFKSCLLAASDVSI